MSAMQEILRRYGQSATLKNPEGEKTIRAFVQPEKAREEGDRISLRFGARTITVEVLSVQETVRQSEAAALYRQI